MLGARRSSLRRLTLRACDLTEHDPDVPLIFDLRPLAQVTAASFHYHPLHACPSGVHKIQSTRDCGMSFFQSCSPACAKNPNYYIDR